MNSNSLIKYRRCFVICYRTLNWSWVCILMERKHRKQDQSLDPIFNMITVLGLTYGINVLSDHLCTVAIELQRYDLRIRATL